MNPDTLSTPKDGLSDPGYRRSITVWLSPRLLKWIVPGSVVAIFVLLFLPWIGAYPSGYPAYTQNAFQTIWGGVSVDSVATSALDGGKPFDTIEKDPFMLLYILLVVLALTLSLSPLVLSESRIQTFRPIIRSVWQRREGLLRTMALGSFVVLMIQLWVGFGFEAAVDAKADATQGTEMGAARSSEAREKANIHREIQLSPLNLRSTIWLKLAVLCNVVFLVGVASELWLKWRGASPLPRIDLRE